MAISEVFIQVTDVPLSLWRQQEARCPQIRIPRPTRAQALRWDGEAGPWGTPLAQAGTYLCPPVLQRSHERPERRGRKRQE